MKKSLLLFFTVFALGLGSNPTLGMRPSPPNYTPEKYVNLPSEQFKREIGKMKKDVLLNLFNFLMYDAQMFEDYFIPALEATMIEIDKRDPQMLLYSPGEPYSTEEWYKPKVLVSRAVNQRRPHLPEIGAFFLKQVPWLIKHHEPVDTKYVQSISQNESNPLMDAIRLKWPDMVEILLINKADQHLSLNKKDNSSTTPHDYAQAQATHDTEYQPIVDILNRYNPQGPASALL